jgi:hypothetical protein
MRVEAGEADTKRLGGDRLNSGNTSGSVSDWRGGLAGYCGIHISDYHTDQSKSCRPRRREADFRQMMGITFTTTILSLIMVVIYGSRTR